MSTWVECPVMNQVPVFVGKCSICNTKNVRVAPMSVVDGDAILYCGECLLRTAREYLTAAMQVRMFSEETRTSEPSVPMVYDPKYGDERICTCGHSYERHFDPYEDMAPVGCKYCGCFEFKEVPEERKVSLEGFDTDRSIIEIGLSPAIYSAIRRYSYTYFSKGFKDADGEWVFRVRDLLEISPSEFYRIRHLGKIRRREVFDRMREIGFGEWCDKMEAAYGKLYF